MTVSRSVAAGAPVLVWFREDLRVDDNRALLAAVRTADERGATVQAIWCAVPAQWDAHDMGDNRRWFVGACVRELLATLGAAGIPLTLVDAGDFAGSVRAVLAQARAIGATDVFLNDEYPLNEVRRDASLASACVGQGIELHRYDDGVLVSPRALLNKSGSPYTVFTPYRQGWYGCVAGDPGLQPRAFRAPAVRVADAELKRVHAASRKVLDAIQVSLSVPDSVRTAWVPGEQEALRRLQLFCDESIHRYQQSRDLPAVPGTSTLSPYLAAGCLSPRRALAAARMANRGDFADGNAGVVIWISELAWRDFYRQVMFHFPHVAKGRAFRPATEAVPWRPAGADFAAWCEGRTGYPLVDAAMRQLLATGWMHNRLRMVAAMFLSKDLLVDWRAGERWFARHLVDWDFAANNGGWQWSASTGTDAAPYFRLFNPVRQAERFDPAGVFVRHWLPALRDVPDRWVHEPWRATEKRKGKADLFATAAAMPEFAPPIVDHAQAKARVLAAFRIARDDARQEEFSE